MKIYYNPKLKEKARELRNNSTLSEVLLWNKLKQKQMLGYQFYRQKPIGPYIADFYAPAAALVVEVDGAHHFEETQAARDQARTDYLTRHGIRVIRFNDREVLLEIDSVIETIAAQVEARRKFP